MQLQVLLPVVGDGYNIFHHKLHKLLNQNNVKITYSCLPNKKSVITHTTEIYYTCHQLLAEELATASIYHNVPYNKGVLSGSILYQPSITPIDKNSKFTMVFVKLHLK